MSAPPTTHTQPYSTTASRADCWLEKCLSSSAPISSVHGTTTRYTMVDETKRSQAVHTSSRNMNSVITGRNNIISIR